MPETFSMIGHVRLDPARPIGEANWRDAEARAKEMARRAGERYGAAGTYTRIQRVHGTDGEGCYVRAVLEPIDP